MPRDTNISEFLFPPQFVKEVARPSIHFLCCKRTIDILTSLMLLPIIAGVCLIALILNPIWNPGKLFYAQMRVGKDRKIFKMYKLRTMRGGSDSTKFATQETTRITPLGKFMRDIHIDELAQIFNVFLGDMSLIGPRPEQLAFFQDYAQSINGFTLRQSVRPGISGLAQLRRGYTDCPAGAKNKLRWDLEYIRKQGYGLDTKIYLLTYVYVFPRIIMRLLSLIKINKNS